MTDISRRHLMTGAAAAAGLAAIAPLAHQSPARAAAPAVGKQAPGYYRYKVSTFEVTAITDGGRAVKLPDNFARNASKDDLSGALASLYMDKESPVFPFTPLSVNTGSKLVLIDTGNGPSAFEQSKGAVGQLQNNLVSAGIDKSAVDTVIISHFHGDHINGLLGTDGKPIYVNAEVIVPATEWAFWMDDGNMSRAPDGLKGNFNNVRRVFGALGKNVTQFEAGKDVIPGIRSMATPGHTPGHTAFIISSGSQSVLAQVDVTAGPALVTVKNPDWQFAFDMDGPQAVATRRKLYDQAIADRMLVQGYHFPFPSAGYIEKDGNGYRFVPAAWNSTI